MKALGYVAFAYFADRQSAAAGDGDFLSFGL